MLKDLKSPHAFATFSAADCHWRDLHRHMPTQVPRGATEQERIKVYNSKSCYRCMVLPKALGAVLQICITVKIQDKRLVVEV